MKIENVVTFTFSDRVEASFDREEGQSPKNLYVHLKFIFVVFHSLGTKTLVKLWAELIGCWLENILKLIYTHTVHI